MTKRFSRRSASPTVVIASSSTSARSRWPARTTASDRQGLPPKENRLQVHGRRNQSTDSRLANCDNAARRCRRIAANMPASFEVDWKALVLNNDRWWNTGAPLMLWSGAHKDAARRRAARRRPWLPPARRRVLQRRHRVRLRHRTAARRDGVRARSTPPSTGPRPAASGTCGSTTCSPTPPANRACSAGLAVCAVQAVAELDDEQPVRGQRQHQVQLASRARRW